MSLTLFGGCLLSCSPNHPTIRSKNQDRLELLEHAIWQIANRLRQEHQLDTLQRRPELDSAARQHSQRMATGQIRFGHHGSKHRARLVMDPLHLESVAENVARNRGYEDPVAVAMQGWMASQGHRKNLLGSFDLTGVGVARSEDDTIFFTQVFGRSQR